MASLDMDQYMNQVSQIEFQKQQANWLSSDKASDLYKQLPTTSGTLSTSNLGMYTTASPLSSYGITIIGTTTVITGDSQQDDSQNVYLNNPVDDLFNKLDKLEEKYASETRHTKPREISFRDRLRNSKFFR